MSRTLPKLTSGERAASHQRSRRFMVSLGLVGLAVLTVMVVIGFNAPNSIPGRSYYTVKAVFDQADNLTGHYQVRVSGKLVGQVLNPRVVDGKAVVDLQMEPDVGPLPEDSTVEVRPRSAVGVRYVDIRPGTSRETLPEGATIPAAQTSATRQLDEVLATVDRPARRHTGLTLQESGRGFAGRGEGLNTTIDTLGPTVAGAERVAGAINDRPGSVAGLIRGAGVGAGTYSPVRDTLAAGFDPEAAALRPFALERSAVQDTLGTAPPALDTFDARLPQVDGLARELSGLGTAIRPALQRAPGALRATTALLRDARPGLDALDGTLVALGDAVDPTLALLDRARPVLPHVDATLRDATPIVARLGEYGCDFSRWGKRWTSMTAYGNESGGGTLRFNLVTLTPFGLTENVPDILASDTRNAYPAPCTAGEERLGG